MQWDMISEYQCTMSIYSSTPVDLFVSGPFYQVILIKYLWNLLPRGLGKINKMLLRNLTY